MIADYNPRQYHRGLENSLDWQDRVSLLCPHLKDSVPETASLQGSYGAAVQLSAADGLCQAIVR